MLAVAEGLDVAQRRVGIAERQAQHRDRSGRRLRQHLLGEPAVVGPAQVDLHLLLRMQADVEHAGREQAGIVDAHRVHPAIAELDVAQRRRRRRSFSDDAQRIAGDAAAHVLVADLARHDAAAAAFGARSTCVSWRRTSFSMKGRIRR